ncbi:hypothetical protein [uncultured Paraglaciecola sp.]|uniref:hypothetical protein n=1 Tax=uncultured Paraglaciecola sp. TaxID=1765024 RepID=UPI00259879C2|nr:hypothetical protein [uncultured Paraglaciecola sp.]
MLERLIVLIIAVVFTVYSLPFAIHIFFDYFVSGMSLVKTFVFSIAALIYGTIALFSFYVGVNAQNMDYRIFNRSREDSKVVMYIPLIVFTLIQVLYVTVRSW